MPQPLRTEMSLLAMQVREELEARWVEFHKDHDDPNPDIVSTHLCRETSVIGLMVLEALGYTGWRIEGGEIPIDAEDREVLPLDITDVRGYGIADEDLTSVAHTWLVNDEENLILDLTADQFGSLFVPTADEAFIETASSMRHVYVLDAEDIEDWKDDPDVMDRVQSWSAFHKIWPLINDLSEELERKVDLAHIHSVVPRDVRLAIKKIRACSFDEWMPTDPVFAYEKIQLYKKLDDAQWGRPHPEARTRAAEALRELVLNDTAANAPWTPRSSADDPAEDRASTMKHAENLLIREYEIQWRRTEETTPAAGPAP